MDVSKLAQLRSKTNRQLVAVIGSSLNAGRDDVRRGCYARAGKAYEEARVLLPLVDNLTPAERHRLESRLARLGEALEERIAATGSDVQTAACL